ncbi:MAG: hypothetical protein HY958_05030 [Bacteroidia bacterium]|nr:hypothetical protein [Bacteroidia bacterium]
MKSYIKNIFLVLAVSVMIHSCKMAETASSPMSFRMEILAKSPSDYKLYIHKGAGQYELLSPVGGSTYDISIPAMNGGYSKFLFIVYNKHDPNDYKVIHVKKEGEIIKELSLREIQQLKYEKNIYKLKL